MTTATDNLAILMQKDDLIDLAMQLGATLSRTRRRQVHRTIERFQREHELVEDEMIWVIGKACWHAAFFKQLSTYVEPREGPRRTIHPANLPSRL